MTDQKRPYRKKLRAEQEQATRLRITESAVALHATLGPSQTSMSAIAEHAGVRRSTLYRHFPDEAAVFAACSSHYMASNPLPELERWAAISDSDERLRFALRELYAYYQRTAPMMSNLLRDAETVPLVGELFGPIRAYFDAARRTLISGRRVRGAARKRLYAAIGHALAFSTWRSLVQEQGLENADASELMCSLISATSRNTRQASLPVQA